MSRAFEAVKRFVVRKKQLILYLLFGGVTTVCSLLAWYLTLRFGVLVFHDEKGDPTAFLDVLGSTAQWVVGIVVTFTTNKKWVFREAEHGLRAAVRQFGIFCSSRVLTYFLEVAVNLGIIALLDDLLHYHAPVFEIVGREFELSARIWAKLISSIVVIVANYFVSKLIVFRKKDEKDPKEDKKE
ncbi:MAG: GtrA family protein [Clostridia bacterium]|nr:GtrA family protein [Clostridia bacterium]